MSLRSSISGIRTSAFGVLLTLLATAAYGQENYGKIIGTVTDTTGGVVPNVTIVATSPAVPRGLETQTDSAGNYLFSNVPIGVYTVTFTVQGFQTFKQTEVEVTLGSQVTVSPKLAVGSVSETVEVTADALQIDTTSTRTATNITASEFQQLETGRSFNSLLQLAPGVRNEVKAGAAGVGGISVDGASGSENAYIIDGVDVSDIRRGSLRSFNSIPLELVQEVQVRSAGFEAEYGGATGGVVTVATKSGTNTYHGQIDYAFTGSVLNSRDRGFWQRSPANADAPDFFAPKKDDYGINYPGATIGGPILRDRLFFLGSYHPEVESTQRTNRYPSGTRVYNQDIIRHYGLGRLDYNPTSRIQINTSWIWSPQKINGYLPSRDIRVAPPTNDLSVQGGYSPSQAYNASITYAATTRLILTARYGYKFLNDKGGTTGTGGNYGLSGAPYVSYLTAASAAGLPVPAEVNQAKGYSNVSTTLGIVNDITTRHNLYLDASYIANIAGQQHAFKFGYALARLSNDVKDDYTNGFFTINWGDAFSRGSVNNERGTYGYYTWEDGVRHDSAVHSRNQGFYVQDAWRVTRRLTINAGIRLENEYLPPYRKEVNGKGIPNPISFDWGSKIAPRLGLAWDVMGDGKWKVAGSYGLFYDTMKYELARGSFGGDIWFSNVYRLDNPNVFSLSKANPGALGALITRYDNRTVPINAQGQLDGIDPNIKPTRSREFSFILEHQLASRLVSGFRYTHKNLLRTIEDIGVLDAEDSEVYLIGNPGEGWTRNDPNHVFDGKTPNGNYLVPEAKRQYDAAEFSLQGQARNLTFLGSYTWSRLYGNYSGLANSDESGRSDPGVSRAFDLPFYYFDDTGSQKNVEGRLGTDRPHTFKLFGSYDLKTVLGTTTFSLNQIAYSGTPDTTTVIYLSAPTSPYGRGDLGRTPFLTQTDLAIKHTIKLNERVALRLEGDIRNLFNQAAPISRVTQLNRNSAITSAQVSFTQFFAGYDPTIFVNPQNINKVTGKVNAAKYQPIYGLPGGSYRNGGGPDGTTDRLSSAFAASYPGFGAYQDVRVIRLGLRLQF
jgi:hypothetical protein